MREGWTRVAFGDVVKLSRERSNDPIADGFDRYVGLEHLDPGDLKIRRWGNTAAGTSFTNVFRPGQVLFGKRRAYQRKVAVADFSGVCSGDIYVFEPAGPKLVKQLLPFICQSERFLNHAVGTSAGSLSPRTNWERLAAFSFELPDPESQRQIADLLGAGRILQDSFRQAEEAAEQISRAVLLDAFRPDRGTVDRFPRHWRIATADSVGDVQLGQQRHPIFEHGSNMRPYLRVANVMDGWISFDDVLRMHFPEAELGKFEIHAGDILLNEGQSTELVGRSAIYHGEVPGCCIQKTLIRYRCHDDLRPEFIQAFFRHCLYTSQFAQMVVQTTSMAHLTAVRFRKMLLPVPPRAEQDRIADLLATAMASADRVRRRRQAAIQMIADSTVIAE